MPDVKRKMLLSACFIICGVVLIDVFVGVVCNITMRHLPANNSECAKLNHVLTRAAADCIIVGSSRADHHYNSILMENGLGMSTYNAGMDGQTLPYIGCAVHAICQREPFPRLIVMEMHYAGMQISPDDRISKLKPFFNSDPYYRDVILDVCGESERYKCLSAMYRYNGYPLRIVNAFFSEQDTMQGYVPLDDRYHYPPSFQVDSVRYGIEPKALRIFDQTVEIIRNKGIGLVVVISPEYVEHIYPSPVEEVCRERGILFLDNSDLEEFMNNEAYFKDIKHLNAHGADVYTRYFIGQLKELDII